MYLLDTSACIVHLRSKGQSGLSRKLMSVNRRLIQVSAVVRGELVVGAMRATDPARGLAAIDNLLALFRSVPFDDHAANLTVVTRDVDDYARVVGLRVENWT